VIITRTPLRISLGGGGTDLPSYYEQYGGFVVSAAINKYIYVAMNRTFSNDYFLKYSSLERVDEVDDIEHPIVRQVFRDHDVEPSIEMVSVADIPAGTGLGSSGSFTVGLLEAVAAFQRQHSSTAELAEEACMIEIEKLGRSVGKQDQYIAAFGGLTSFTFKQDGSVGVQPLQIPSNVLCELEENLLMFFTGYARDAEFMLDDQKKRSQTGDEEMIRNLNFIKEAGYASKQALEAGDLSTFAKLMHEHWLRKRERSHGMSNKAIDNWYDLGMKSGALGGKLVGAGAGGFLLFYTEQPRKLREAFSGTSLREVRFTFDFDGSVISARD
jgi:D-glycero-alpha-D-manno-heptose-7-phosphate kinase